MKRARGKPYSRSGLPLTCGVKLPNGEECRAPAGPMGGCAEHSDPDKCPLVPVQLVPERMLHYYLIWLRGQGREETLPDDLDQFLYWWDNVQWLDGERPPWGVNWDGFKKLWLRRCELTGRPVLVPFDLTLFCEWWKVT